MLLRQDLFLQTVLGLDCLLDKTPMLRLLIPLVHIAKILWEEWEKQKVSLPLLDGKCLKATRRP